MTARPQAQSRPARPRSVPCRGTGDRRHGASRARGAVGGPGARGDPHAARGAAATRHPHDSRPDCSPRRLAPPQPVQQGVPALLRRHAHRIRTPAGLTRAPMVRRRSGIARESAVARMLDRALGQAGVAPPPSLADTSPRAFDAFHARATGTGAAGECRATDEEARRHERESGAARGGGGGAIRGPPGVQARRRGADVGCRRRGERARRRTAALAGPAAGRQRRRDAAQRPVLPGRLLRRAARRRRRRADERAAQGARGDVLSRRPGREVRLRLAQFAEEARHGAGEAGARVIEVAPGDFEEQLRAAEPWRELADRGREDTAVILYTSGTTGKPKGAELTHGNLDDNARVCEARLFGLDEHDVVLGALPLFHAFGQTVCMNCAALVGACLTMIARFDPAKALEIIQRDDVTMFAGVPTMYNAMLHHPERDRYDTSCLRLCVSGGAAMPEEVMRAFEEAFACKVLEGYGLSETSPVASFNHPDRERKPGSIGTPIEGVEMKLVDGEIAIRGHNVMKGYWNRPDATEKAMQDSWFLTGDVARVDDDGYFFIVDRKKDMIIRGGYNVYPREIEEVLYEHPAVSEAAVVGVPDESMGEEVGAAVVLREGAEATPDEIRAFVKERVAAYKYPRKVWIADELPKGPTGKILKREIKVPESVAR